MYKKNFHTRFRSQLFSWFHDEMKRYKTKDFTVSRLCSHDLCFIFVSCAEQQGAAACHTDLLLDVHANF